ncbi:hypothetical protein [Pseudomonas sp. ANT_J28]|uniref:hypothetical protein n=1 Tax=Pseudomonas sp. ANT_J28 TaxID=2597352 RepID=UPI0011F37A2D|nr:hypothetical protein [Pseudomonas sp. ANT_J28]KAA0984817.1 hypothetical protein FQ187_07370 [Pseudomonas sp. ANT_J28]
MMIFKSIIESLARSIVHLHTEETNTTVIEKFRVGELGINREALARSLSCIYLRDSFVVSLAYSDSDQVDSLVRHDNASIEAFCDRLKLQIDEESTITGILTITITKGFAGRTCSIYSLDLIEQYWRTGGVAQSATKLRALSERSYIIESSEISSTFSSGLFVFRPSGQTLFNITNPETANKEKLLVARDKCCLFYESKNYQFIPQDFNLSPAFEHLGIRELFNTLKLIFSIIFLADVSSLDSKILTATIKGYRHVTGTIQFDSFKDGDVATAYYEIYLWAYTDGSVTDKLGIARNLLSIHIDGNDFRALRDGGMPAIISNYSIYLKDNVKQYIDIKNKLSDQIQKQSEKASEMVKSIGTYLRTSIFSVYSFVITTFIIRSMSKASTDVVFSDGIYVIFIMFITLSIGTLIYAYKEAEAELNRFESIYDAFKSRFDDLLSKSDRERILQNDQEYKRDVEYVKNSRKRAVCLWLACLLLVFLFVTVIKLLKY